MTDLEKRLIALSALGIVIRHDSGHRWLYCLDDDDGFDFNRTLRKDGVLVNNKIYGGIIEALDVVDKGLQMTECLTLLETFESWGLEGDVDVYSSDRGESRIDKVAEGRGGLC